MRILIALVAALCVALPALAAQNGTIIFDVSNA